MLLIKFKLVKIKFRKDRAIRGHFSPIYFKFNKLSLQSCVVAGRANCRRGRGRRRQIRGRRENWVLYSINHSTFSAFPRYNFSSMAHCGESLDGLYSYLVRLPDEYLFDLSFSQFMVLSVTAKRMDVLNLCTVQYTVYSIYLLPPFKHSHILAEKNYRWMFLAIKKINCELSQIAT